MAKLGRQRGRIPVEAADEARMVVRRVGLMVVSFVLGEFLVPH